MNKLLKFETFEELKAYDAKISTNAVEAEKRFGEFKAFVDYIKLHSVKVAVTDKSKK